MQTQYFKYYSPALNRDMECKIYHVRTADSLILRITKWQMYGNRGLNPAR